MAHFLEVPGANGRTSRKGSTVSALGKNRLNDVTIVVNDDGEQNNELGRELDMHDHKVFVQLNELTGTGDDQEWKQTARWIKYEQNVEEGGDRWGRPHIASLSFNALLNLRRCLEMGIFLMDLEAYDLSLVANRVVEQMVIDEQIHADDKEVLVRALLLRHRNVNENSHAGIFYGARRRLSSFTSIQSFKGDNKKPRIVPAAEINGSAGYSASRIQINDDAFTSSHENIRVNMQKESLLKRIPEGAEATSVLVGAFDFLEHPTIAFVRLAESIPMPSITEVPIPVRFLFILLGPQQTDLDYHEVGRSISTLMSNEHFHDIARIADDRRDLISAINEFLDDSIVLPPGRWDRQELLPIEELKARSDMIRMRKRKSIKHSQLLTSEEQKKLLAISAVGNGAGGGDDEEDDGERYARKLPVNPLEKTNCLWGGLFNDIKRRYRLYKSDITDGLNTETLSATIFMYFATLSTAITFGGLYTDKTDNLIGISESLLSDAMFGMMFHLLAGQPLLIIGTTGPLVLFDEALYQFCTSNGFNFLTLRVYIGCWLLVIALLVSAIEGSVYVRMFTRFTQEIFSALITLLFIFETVIKLVSVYTRNPLLSEYMYKNNTLPVHELNKSIGSAGLLYESQTIINTGTDSDHLLLSEDANGPLNQPNTALLCTILTLGTFSLAYYLKLFRNSHFLGRTARRALGDFGVPISIAIFVLLDYMIPQVYTEKLRVPEGISPSEPTRRGWLIPYDDVPLWLPLLASIPALLMYILVFMETHIAELILDKPERGLKKGSGLHLDIVLLCIVNTACGFLGMPWHSAATVRSVAHVSAVTIMSKTHAIGDAPHIADVKEQRISGFFVALFVGLSVLMAPILRLIPMAVLFGVFLYLGVASTSGVQFFERLRLFLMPVKHHPQVPFVRRVPTKKMHLFTFIQIMALAVMLAVKASPFAMAFPSFLIFMVPIRKQMEKYFSPLELRALDSSKPNEGAEDEPDFYEQAHIPV